MRYTAVNSRWCEERTYRMTALQNMGKPLAQASKLLTGFRADAKMSTGRLFNAGQTGWRRTSSRFAGL